MIKRKHKQKMPLNTTRIRQHLKESNFKALFVDELGWDHHASCLVVPLDQTIFTLTAIAHKRGMITFECDLPEGTNIPDYATRRKIERQVTKAAHEHLIIYTDKNRTIQIWQWVKREAGKPTQCREHTYYCGQPGDAIIQKLQAIAFSLDEEEGLTIVDVTSRIRAGFDVDRVTKKFYDRFKTEHDAFLKFLKGIPDEEMQRWYVSVMLNRLMFIYFIQKKAFLDNNSHYLLNKLAESKQRGKDRFYSDFLCPLFFEGFARKEEDRPSKINQLLGRVPYLNGGIFQRHQIEELYGKTIQISDTAFEKLFSFFDQYQWHLDERPLRSDNEINPDVLGYIFEKYINQKQMGAYYTKEDITEYISKNTIVPYLFEEAKKNCRIAFVPSPILLPAGERDGVRGDSPHSTVWHLLQADPDRYIYDAVKKGADLPLPKEIATGLSDVSKRTEWNKPALPDYALPTEIWREVVARRKRYEEVRAKLENAEIQDINDLITYNLNIRQFAQDVIENSEGPELLRAFWHAIERVTVLDPTCGSGAFLFAALNILEPLYEACLDRMEVFLDELSRSGEKHRADKFSDFRKILDRIKEHPNRRYFIFKSIIVNNLYGVDIMEEAIEICKLRLFLKLVAQVDRDEDIEPLPDIDFNIRAGNTLVGYATYDEVKKAVLGDTQGKLDLGKDMQRIDEKAQDVDRLFGLFRQQQTELGGEVSSADKWELRNRLKILEGELNRYLAGEYKVDLKKKDAYEKWLGSHKPFHWFIEFYGIIKEGGFNAIIGNPPYVELKALEGYKARDYACEEAGNTYALVMERCFTLSGDKGRRGLIVPVSSISTDRYLSLQRLITQHRIFYSSFDDRPSRLFEGLEHARLTIHFVGEQMQEHSLFSTRYNKWTSLERPSLFESLQYTRADRSLIDGSLPKLSSSTEQNVIHKLLLQQRRLSSFYARASRYQIFYSRKVGYFVQALDFEPKVISGAGELRPPSEFKQLGFVNERHTKGALCCLNSNLFYWFITVFSDCRHVNKREVDGFPVDLDRLMEGHKGNNLLRLVSNLMSDLRQNSEERKMSFKHDSLTVQCIFPKHSKPIIDRVDYVLAQHYGFTDEELDFIINYDIKYRMGRDAGEEAEKEED